MNTEEDFEDLTVGNNDSAANGDPTRRIPWEMRKL